MAYTSRYQKKNPRFPISKDAIPLKNRDTSNRSIESDIKYRGTGKRKCSFTIEEIEASRTRVLNAYNCTIRSNNKRFCNDKLKEVLNEFTSYFNHVAANFGITPITKATINNKRSSTNFSTLNDVLMIDALYKATSAKEKLEEKISKLP